MCFQKIKKFLKNKKVQVIAGPVAGALVLTLSGAMILNNKNVENKNIVIEKDDKKDFNKENNEIKEQLEELKSIDTSNMSDEEKKELENKIADTENKVANNNDEASKEVTSNTSTSKPNSTSTAIENSGTSTNTNKGSNSNSNSSNNTENSNSGSTVGNTNNKEEAHIHNWVAINSTVHHDEVGYWEDVVVKPAWTESIPVYEDQARDICNTCNADLTGTDIASHVKKHMMAGEDKGGHRTEWVQVQVGTNTVNHPAVTENKWVVDKAAWDETVTTGYKCSGCGATK